MERLSFDAFNKKIRIASPLGKIYRSWATEAGICSWFLRTATYITAEGDQRAPGEGIRAGDRYTWKWHNFDFEERGEILEADGTRTLEFSFAGECRVRVTLEEAGDHVLVCLRQYNIPTDDADKIKYFYGCGTGWTFWLANLKAWLEHGILLHETDQDLSDDPLAGYEFVNV